MKARIVFVVAVAVAVVGGLVAAPRRYVVDGVSMGPSLLPGDVVGTRWLAVLDHWRPPGRFERWIVTLPDGSTGLKRVVGLPGETVEFVAGDLVVAGRAVLKSPRAVAEMGSRLEGQVVEGLSWSWAPVTVLDDAPFAVGEVSRLLLPVRDVGFAAEVVVTAAATPVPVRAVAGPLTVRWRLHAPGRYAVVAGRLDGHAVAVAWPLADGRGSGEPDRHCLPPLVPEAWDVARPWPEATVDAAAPSLALAVGEADGAAATIERVTLWRDGLLRPTADGVARWQVGEREVFLLGDFPSGSRDSRQFGPFAHTALRHRVGPR